MDVAAKFNVFGPKVDDLRITEFESEFSVRLPTDYREALEVYNPHCPNSPFLGYQPANGEGFVLQKLFAIDVELPWELFHMNRYSDTPEPFVDIGSGVCGDTLSIECSGRKAGRLVWFDHEYENGAPIDLAPSFSNFINGLSKI